MGLILPPLVPSGRAWRKSAEPACAAFVIAANHEFEIVRRNATNVISFRVIADQPEFRGSTKKTGIGGAIELIMEAQPRVGFDSGGVVERRPEVARRTLRTARPDFWVRGTFGSRI